MEWNLDPSLSVVVVVVAVVHLDVNLVQHTPLLHSNSSEDSIHWPTLHSYFWTRKTRPYNDE